MKIEDKLQKKKPSGSVHLVLGRYNGGKETRMQQNMCFNTQTNNMEIATCLGWQLNFFNK